MRNTEPKCTLTDEELISRAEKWVYDLTESGGKKWCLRVPVDFNHDPDMLFLELCNRLKQRALPGNSGEGDAVKWVKATNGVGYILVGDQVCTVVDFDTWEDGDFEADGLTDGNRYLISEKDGKYFVSNAMNGYGENIRAKYEKVAVVFISVISNPKKSTTPPKEDTEKEQMQKAINRAAIIIEEKDNELVELREWKQQAMSVMPDYQAIGKELNIKIGESIHDKILPGIMMLKQKYARPSDMGIFIKIACNLPYKTMNQLLEELGDKLQTDATNYSMNGNRLLARHLFDASALCFDTAAKIHKARQEFKK